jgi:hypothetical protein
VSAERGYSPPDEQYARNARALGDVLGLGPAHARVLEGIRRGLPGEEVARVVGVPVGTVKSRTNELYVRLAGGGPVLNRASAAALAERSLALAPGGELRDLLELAAGLPCAVPTATPRGSVACGRCTACRARVLALAVLGAGPKSSAGPDADAVVCRSIRNASDRDRVFEVWLERPGREPALEVVEVPAGEDADALCERARLELVEGHVDSGWREVRRRDEKGGSP